MLGIGFYYSRGIKNTEDYFLSGRRFGAFPIGCTLAVSFIGGGMFMGVNGMLAKYGIVIILIVIALALSFVILGLLFGPRLRRLNIKTLPQFMAKRFDEKTRMLIAIISLIALLGSLAIQFKASGAILNTVFDIPYFWAVLFSVAVVTLYTGLGGFRSVVATDVIQTIIIFIGVVIALPFVLNAAGGPTQVISTISGLQDGEFLNFFSQGITFVIGIFILLMVFAIIAPENHQRLYASRDPGAAKRGGIYAGIFYFVVLSIVFLIGIIGLVFYPNLGNPDNFFPLLATQILPVWLGGILLAAVAAAIMSSGDTDLVTASSITITDFYERYKKTPVGQQKLVKLSRISVIIIALFGFIIALAFRTVVDLLTFYNSLLAAVAAAPIVFGLFWKRATSQAAFWGGVSGGVVNLVLFGFGSDPAKNALPSVAVACVVLVVFSLKKKHAIIQPRQNSNHLKLTP